MKIISTAGLLVLFIAPFAFAQSGNSDRCAVVMVDVTGRNAKNLEKAPSKELGQFDTVIAEEERTTKSYRIPETNLYLVASVFYTDESMGTNGSRDSVSLQLAIQRNPKRDLLRSIQYAEAEVMLPNMDVARVSTLFRSGRRSLVFLMQCSKNVRLK